MIVIIIVSFIFMLVPTFMMGGTLPVISRCYVKNRNDIGTGVGRLYAINTLGAIIGAGLTGYFLIGHFGQIQTQLLAIIISLILGYMAKSLPEEEMEIPEEKNSTPTVNYPNHVLTFLLAAAGITGFCGLAYEILTTRALSIFLVNSSYSFTSILIIYLLGISLGSFIYSKFYNNNKHNLLLLALCQIIIGLYLIIITAYLNDLPLVLDPLRKNVLKISQFKVFLPGLLLSSLMLLIPALCMGISFPAVCKVYTTSVKNIGRKIGNVYFINTLGSIIGPLLAAFFLIPLFGVSKGILIIAFFCIILGILLLILEEPFARKAVVISGALILVLFSFFFIPRGIEKSMLHPPSIFRTKGQKDAILFYKETLSGTIVAREDKATGIRTLYVNNNAVCGLTYDAVMVVKMLGHLPFIANTEIKEVLIIGFGIGVTTSEVAKHTIENIDCIEIAPGVKDAAKYFSEFNRNIIHHPKVNFISGDGRNYLLLTDKKYDLISCDPTHPTLGCGSLYTKEFFQLCKEHLRENGVVSQYLPLHRLSIKEFKSIIKTFNAVFPNTTVWLAHSHCILLGTQENFKADFRFLSSFLRILNDAMFNDPYQVVSLLFLDKDAISRFAHEAPVHTDNRPFLEYYTPKSIKKENWHLNISEMIKYRIDPTGHFIHIPHRKKMIRYIAGQRFFINGLIHKNKGYKSKADVEKVIAYFKNASKLNPANREIKMFLNNELQQYKLLNKVQK
jgi:spermidine synthase